MTSKKSVPKVSDENNTKTSTDHQIVGVELMSATCKFVEEKTRTLTGLFYRKFENPQPDCILCIMSPSSIQENICLNPWNSWSF